MVILKFILTDETGVSMQVAVSQPPASGDGDAPFAVVATCPSSLHEHPLHVLPVETPTSSQKPDLEPHELAISSQEQNENEIKPPVLSDVTKTQAHPGMGDGLVREPMSIQNPVETYSAEPAELHQGDSAPSSISAPPLSQSIPVPPHSEVPFIGEYLALSLYYDRLVVAIFFGLKSALEYTTQYQ